MSVCVFLGDGGSRHGLLDTGGALVGNLVQYTCCTPAAAVSTTLFITTGRQTFENFSRPKSTKEYLPFTKGSFRSAVSYTHLTLPTIYSV